MERRGVHYYLVADLVQTPHRGQFVIRITVLYDAMLFFDSETLVQVDDMISHLQMTLII